MRLEVILFSEGDSCPSPGTPRRKFCRLLVVQRLFLQLQQCVSLNRSFQLFEQPEENPKLRYSVSCEIIILQTFHSVYASGLKFIVFLLCTSALLQHSVLGTAPCSLEAHGLVSWEVKLVQWRVTVHRLLLSWSCGSNQTNRVSTVWN